MGLSNYLPNSRISQSGVCTSSTRPVSPYEGQMIYETDTNRVLVWDNAAWVMIADTDQPPGLQLVKTQTVGTAVSSVTVSDCFNADFDDYQIIGTGITCSSTDNVIYARLDNHTTSSYSYAIRGLTYAGANVESSVAASNVGLLIGGTSTIAGFSTDLFAPNKATMKKALGSGATNNGVFVFGSIDTTATARTGVTIRPSAGTFTGGEIRVYGYRNA